MKKAATARGARRECCGRGAGARGGRPVRSRGLSRLKVRLLAFNDFHGHLEPTTPGRINDPVTGASVLAGGAEYFATHMKALGSENGSTFVVGAGDMIGGTPLLSGALPRRADDRVPQPDRDRQRRRRQPRVRRGQGRAPAHAVRQSARRHGCHPVDGCQDGTPFFGSSSATSQPTSWTKARATRSCRRYAFVNTRAGKVAFIGETLENTPLDRHAVRRCGARLPRRGRHGERARVRS